MINKSSRVYVGLQDVRLIYELHHDRTNNLKEYIINFFRRKKYVDVAKEKLHALNGIDLDIHEGERVGIIGLNGAGKSTLLKVISGILKPSSGRIEVHGNIQPLIEIGAGFDPEFTGRENIYLNSYMLGFTKKQVQAQEDKIIEFADLGKFIDTPIKYYSSGMSVRLAFSIATMISPEILVLDEMLSAGDAAFLEKAKKRIDGLINQAKIMVVVSHDLSLIQSICNRCLIVRQGKVIFDGKTENAIKQYLESIKS
ncbi:MAG: ABC transporter ATP-binding protein [Bdellovibrionaceae bacterium]|nr:ABC transporter ATP-binding protein [Pseudobdellovibrionaceae bacterium]